MWHLLLVLLLLLPALAEDPPNSQVAVLEPSTGKVLGHYLLMRSMQERIEAGLEDPHFEYLREFSFYPEVDPSKLVDEQGRHYSRPNRMDEKAFLGMLPNGDKLIWFRKKMATRDFGTGPLKSVTPDGRQRVLLTDRMCMAPGWRPLLKPGACVAGPFLLSEEPDGASCRQIEDGQILWKARWKFAHCRWNLGAWYAGGALYVDSDRGLARVDADTGKILWAWKDSVELLDVRIYPDGLLYVQFQYGIHRDVFKGLRKMAAERFHWPVKDLYLRAIPYKATYFGATWYGKDYLKDGKVAIWESLNGDWSFVFAYDCQGKTEAELDALFARYQFSPIMRKQLTTDSLETVYRTRDGKLPPER